MKEQNKKQTRYVRFTNFRKKIGLTRNYTCILYKKISIKDLGSHFFLQNLVSGISYVRSGSLMLKRKANKNTQWQVKRECNKLDLGSTKSQQEYLYQVTQQKIVKTCIFLSINCVKMERFQSFTGSLYTS